LTDGKITGYGKAGLKKVESSPKELMILKGFKLEPK
jgi:hypothetical protein